MGNIQQNVDKNIESDGASRTPKKTTNNIFSKIFSNEKHKPKSASKENLYSLEKPFENFENTAIFGYRLESDPEERDYYLNCPNCNKSILDNGLSNIIECKICSKKYNLDEVLEANNNSLKKSRFKKIQELNNLVIITEKDTLLDNFLFIENNQINYDLITKKILLPYYKMKSRIMKKNMFFKIGEIGFKVIGISPFKKGVVTSRTFIHCNNYYSLKTPIKRALLITTSKYGNFDEKVLKREIVSDSSNLINKGEIVNIRHYEFIIRNCEPDSGILTNESVITIENKDIINITKLKIAILKNNVPQFHTPVERLIYEDYILKEYFRPYFLSGLKKYVERGDVFQIEDIEMFILNSFPDNGFICNDTQVAFKLQLNKEKCLDKINIADNKYALKLSLENNLLNGENLSASNLSYHQLGHNNVTNSTLDQVMAGQVLQSSRLNISDLNLNRINNLNRYYNMNRFNIYGLNNFNGFGINEISNFDIPSNHTDSHTLRNLPTFTVDKEYLKNLDKESEQVIKKCVVCMDFFEIKEELKTLPCFHIFHSSCVDEWLKSNNHCPICKSSIN